jgi:excisionase family DNA binding protein
MSVISIEIDEGLVERIAERAAALIAERPVAPGYINVAGAAEFLACPHSRIYALVSARRLPHHRDGSRLLFDRSELRDFVLAGGARRP